VDGGDDDNGSQGILPGGGSSSSCGSGETQDVPFFDLEQLLFPFPAGAGTEAATGSVAIKEETHDDVVAAKNDVTGNGPAPLTTTTTSTTSSWTDTTTIKTELEGFSAATEAPLGGVEDLEMDNYFSELFPDLAVAEAGIIL